MKKLGLSFSGGGVKALVYLGVLKALYDNAIEVHAIGALSGGAIIAGLFGTGKSFEEIESIIKNVNISSLLDVNPFDGVEILDQERVLETFKTYVGDFKIENTKPALAIFATDLDERKAAVMREGDLAEAILASCALSPLMLPYKISGKLLAEGGYSVYYGAKYIREMGADIVVGCDVDSISTLKFMEPIGSIFQSISALVRVNAEKELLLDPVDLDIGNFKDGVNMFDFKKMDNKLVDAGYQRTLEVVPQIKKLLK